MSSTLLPFAADAYPGSTCFRAIKEWIIWSFWAPGRGKDDAGFHQGEFPKELLDPGPIAGASVAAVSQRARRAGLPMISLDPRPRASAPGTLFHITHSAEARARALARWAYRNGVRDFAVLAPKSGYGRAVSAAFTCFS